jgi:hypothetical protein
MKYILNMSSQHVMVVVEANFDASVRVDFQFYVVSDSPLYPETARGQYSSISRYQHRYGFW